MNIQEIIAALGLAQTIIGQGTAVWTQIKSILKANGADMDNTLLDRMIADADARKARAQAVVDHGRLGITGSTGE